MLVNAYYTTLLIVIIYYNERELNSQLSNADDGRYSLAIAVCWIFDVYRARRTSLIKFTTRGVFIIQTQTIQRHIIQKAYIIYYLICVVCTVVGPRNAFLNQEEE
ncbi:Hypothetical_protein [Hexamita inflata]|uniref:Hypothetical_protein n=1 Tax=Hexamita inflata TaxID=28002 RepID=A0AA86QQS8_9EUKA|nr:Hypothetical protein HINF_LOCUS50525 [Hexamita inflata]